MKFEKLKEKHPEVIKSLKVSLGKWYSKYHKRLRYYLIDGNWWADGHDIPEPLVMRAGKKEFIFEGDDDEVCYSNAGIDEL